MPRKSEPTLTNCIRTLRLKSPGMTQQDLADRVGVTRQTIVALEGGAYTPSLAVHADREDLWKNDGSSLSARRIALPTAHRAPPSYVRTMSAARHRKHFNQLGSWPSRTLTRCYRADRPIPLARQSWPGPRCRRNGCRDQIQLPCNVPR